MGDESHRRSVSPEEITQQFSHLSVSNETHAPESLYVASSRTTKCKEDDDFNEILSMAKEAINQGIQPILIAEGSSGSYFVRDVNGKNIGVFKPKDEEPFASLNPKWPKFFQRWLCFCCFGRACLIPDCGYISETGASIVDSFMGLNIVPKTRIVKLASPSFFYSRCCGRVEVKPKEGSFQLFVDNYESATRVFSRWDYDPALLSESEEKKFEYLFQKMIVLDYVIRNTDRHMENLLIKHIPGSVLEIAAIDNGLAFPVKHPECVSRFRTFPFQWADKKWANATWNEGLREHLLRLLTPQFVHLLCKELRSLLFYHKRTNRSLVYNQLRVVRGQIWNLREALQNNETPATMAKRKPVLLTRRYRRVAPSTNNWMEWFRIHPVDNYSNPWCCC